MAGQWSAFPPEVNAGQLMLGDQGASIAAAAAAWEALAAVLTAESAKMAATAGVTASRVGPNRYALDTTLLAGAVTHIVQGTSGSVLTEAGMTGAPSTVCGPGSTWTRADGTAGATFYVKESGSNTNTGWSLKFFE